jgi:hypothetical protein
MRSRIVNAYSGGANRFRSGGTKAESFARERGRPIEPDPGNAGEGSAWRTDRTSFPSFDDPERTMLCN